MSRPTSPRWSQIGITRLSGNGRSPSQSSLGAQGNHGRRVRAGYVHRHRVGQEMPDYGAIGPKPDRAQLRARIPSGELDAQELLAGTPKEQRQASVGKVFREFWWKFQRGVFRSGVLGDGTPLLMGILISGRPRPETCPDVPYVGQERTFAIDTPDVGPCTSAMPRVGSTITRVWQYPVSGTIRESPDFAIGSWRIVD